MTTQAQPKTASPPPSGSKYPRHLGGRLARLVLRFLWLILVIIAGVAVAPNVVALTNRDGIAGFGDPQHLLDIFTIPQLVSLAALLPQGKLVVGIGVGLIFLLSILVALLAGRDARRERRTLREQRMTGGQLASAGAAPARSQATSSGSTTFSEQGNAVHEVSLAATAPHESDVVVSVAASVAGSEAAGLSTPGLSSARSDVPVAANEAEPSAADVAGLETPPSLAAASPDWAAVPAHAGAWYASVTASPGTPFATPAAHDFAESIAAPQEARMRGQSAGDSAGLTSLPAAHGGAVALPVPTTPGARSTPMVEALRRTQAYVSQLSQPLVVENVAVSPAPYAASTPGWTPDRAVQDRQLGRWIDGWADTVVGMAEHAPQLIQLFVADMPSHLNARTWAVSTRLGVTGLSSVARGIDLSPSPHGLVRVLSSIDPAVRALPRIFLWLFGLKIVGRQRDYLFTAMTPGASVGINISESGQDLYLAWDLFIRRVWNEIAVGLVALLAVLVGAFAGVGTVETLKRTVGATTSGLVLGFVGAFLLAGFLTTIGIAALALILGKLSRDDPLAFFLKEIDFFEAHDVQAMVLGVHKSLLAAADQAGINVSLLRAKTEFRTGKRGRVI